MRNISKFSALLPALLGLFSLFIGANLAMGNAAAQASGMSCKAICGISLLASNVFGESFGRLAGASLWAFVGTGLLYLAWRLVKR
ncbi:MAG: hypothetical protein Q7U16_12080 [Agitococcus sp.]|nr:hypothetical protein [Agitococcus sp.]